MLETVGRELTAEAQICEFVVPAGDGQRIAWLHAHGEVLEEADGGEGEQGPQLRLKVRLSARDLGRFSSL